MLFLPLTNVNSATLTSILISVLCLTRYKTENNAVEIRMRLIMFLGFTVDSEQYCKNEGLL